MLARILPQTRGALLPVLWGVMLAVWAPTLFLDFTFDDMLVIVNSPRLHELRAAIEVFRHPAMWSTAMDVGQVGTYRPLALASFVIDYQLYGLRPFGYHLSSVILHVLAQTALFFFFCSWTSSARAALALTLLSACHPGNVEAVAWVNGRSELFAALFGFAALALASSPRQDAGRAALLGLALFLSLMGKESGAIFLPLALAFAALAQARGRGAEPGAGWPPPPLASLRLPALAVVGAALAYAVARLWALGFHSVPRNAGLLKILGTVPAAWYHATQALFVPINRGLAVLNVRAASTGEWLVWIACAVVIVAVVALLLRQRRLLEVTGLLWWLGALAPVTVVLLTEGPWPGLNRWLYIAAPGMALTLYLAASQRLTVQVQRAILVGIGALFVLLCERAIPAWHTDLSLFTTMVEEWPEEFYGYRRLGLVLYQAGNYVGAKPVLKRCVELAPADERDSCGGLYAAAMAGVGECAEAMKTYRSFQPTAMMIPDQFAQIEGFCFERAGQPDRARLVYQACRAVPSCQEALRRLGPASPSPAPPSPAPPSPASPPPAPVPAGAPGRPTGGP